MKYSKTATFLFPLLEIPKAIFTKKKVDNGKSFTKLYFINAYLIIQGKKNKNDRTINLLIDNSDHDTGKMLANIFTQKSYRYYYELGCYIVIACEYSRVFDKDIKLIMNGQYSKISNKAKDLIKKNNFFSNDPRIIPMILNKSETLKISWEKRINTSLENQEVWPIIITEKEIFNHNGKLDKPIEIETYTKKINKLLKKHGARSINETK